MYGFQVFNFSNHTLSRGGLVLEKSSEVSLLLIFRVKHCVVSVLKTGVALVEALEVSHFLS